MLRVSIRRAGAGLVTVALATSALLVALAAPVAAAPCNDFMADGIYPDPVPAGVILCGTSGADGISAVLDGGEFRGRGGNDLVDYVRSGGIFKGGNGNDNVYQVDAGGVARGNKGADVVSVVYGLFIGGWGSDLGNVYSGGEYRGGADDDDGGIIGGGIYKGNGGNDTLLAGLGGKFHGGSGTDDVVTCFGTTLVSVESGSC